MEPFVQRIHLSGKDFNRHGIEVLQVNMGKYCNLACIHCHVESGPNRTELMSLETVDGSRYAWLTSKRSVLALAWRPVVAVSPVTSRYTMPRIAV